MAEKFTNFIFKTTSATTGDIVIVPSGVSGSNTMGYGYGSAVQTRTLGSSEQIHSIYLTQNYGSHLASYADYKKSGTTAIDPLEKACYANIYIIDTKAGTTNRFYVANDIALLPQSSFFIEKNITLTSSQKLCISFYSGAGRNADNKEIFITTSTVELT